MTVHGTHPPTRAMRETPDIDQLKRQARELLEAYRAHSPDAVIEVAAHHRTATPETFVDMTIIEFRPDGSVARRRHHNPDGSEWTSIYEHNGAGRLVTVRTENAAGPVDAQRYEYDSAGCLIRNFHYDYDVRGNWIKKAVEARGGADKDFSVSSIERRTLAYYD